MTGSHFYTRQHLLYFLLPRDLLFLLLETSIILHKKNVTQKEREFHKVTLRIKKILPIFETNSVSELGGYVGYNF
jgi:hypothetical protein